MVPWSPTAQASLGPPDHTARNASSITGVGAGVLGASSARLTMRTRSSGPAMLAHAEVALAIAANSVKRAAIVMGASRFSTPPRPLAPFARLMLETVLGTARLRHSATRTLRIHTWFRFALRAQRARR